jgi:hypothetical protein
MCETYQRPGQYLETQLCKIVFFSRLAVIGVTKIAASNEMGRARWKNGNFELSDASEDGGQ